MKEILKEATHRVGIWGKGAHSVCQMNSRLKSYVGQDPHVSHSQSAGDLLVPYLNSWLLFQGEQCWLLSGVWTTDVHTTLQLSWLGFLEPTKEPSAHQVWCGVGCHAQQFSVWGAAEARWGIYISSALKHGIGDYHKISVMDGREKIFPLELRKMHLGIAWIRKQLESLQ